VTELIENGDQERFLRHLNVEYGRRADLLRTMLSESELSFEISSNITGGYFAWVRLPGGIDAAGLLAERGEVFFVFFSSLS